MIPLHRIARILYGQPLLSTPEAAETVSGVVLTAARSRRQSSDTGDADTLTFVPARHNADGTIELQRPKASRFVGRYETLQLASGETVNSPFPVTPQGVAIITIAGELVNRGSWIGASSGLVAYEAIQHQLSVAAQADRVKAVVLDLDTPGGEASGAFETADAVRELAALKPVVALANGLAASAGYAIASAAREIVVTPSGHVGSIGVVMMHLDYAQALEQQGVKPTLIFAGAHKVDGHPFGPLPEDVKARFEAALETTYGMFLDTVAKGRGKRLPADAARATEARVFMGAEAVAVGLADRTGTLKSVLAALNRQISGRSAATPSNGASMSDNLPEAQASTTAVEGEALLPAGATLPEALAARHAAGVAEGRAAALADVKAIVGSDEAKGKSSLALTLALEGVEPAKAKTILASAPAGAPSLRERMAADPLPDVGTEPGPQKRSAALAAAVQNMIAAGKPLTAN